MRRRVLVGAAVLSVALSASVLAPAPAPAGTGSAAGLELSCNSGSYTVPDGVHLVSAVLTGAAGGDVGFASGGVGGRAAAVLSVFPGQMLTVDAGCAGSGFHGGFGYGLGGDGGSATIVDNKSGGGGGGSAVRLGDTVLLAAGGGGGGNSDSGFSGSGGNGGHPAQPGHPTSPAWGGCGGCESGPDGGTGGANVAISSGGGGGGYRGGGGGAAAGTGGGGGGGSSYAHPGAASEVEFADAARGNGSVHLVPTTKFEQGFHCTAGDSVSFTVPNGWFDMHVEAIGGAGGSTHPHHTVLGGFGGHATATRPVTPGEHFEVTVGCRGDDLDHDASTGRNGGASGWGAGGRGGDAYTEKAHATGGAGGGGASALLQGGDPLVIAGGGGGAAGTLVPNDNLDPRIPQGGKGTVGGNGGDPPQPGADCPDDVGNGVVCFGGGAGELSSPHGAGAPGIPVHCPDDPDSSADASAGAGGGGGGRKGGGGGYVLPCLVFGTNAGGGAGSSWVDPSMANPSFGTASTRDNGSVTLTLTPRKGPTSTAAVTSTPAALVLGDTPTFTTTVGSGFTGVATPTGTVQFVLDDTPIGTVALDANGVATSPPAPVLAQLGAHSITATYSGDASYEPSSVTSPVSVGPTTSSAPVTVSPTPLAVGEGVSATTTVVRGWAQGPTPTGTVSFTIDGVPIGCPPDTPGGCPQEVQADGSASAGPSEPVAYGPHTVVASYSGDANYQPSTGSTTVFAQGDVALELTATYTTVWPWETLTFTATPHATDPTVTDVPTGTVTLSFDDGKALPAFGGGTVPPLSLANGTVTTPTVDQAAMGFGEHTVLAAYSGDEHFQPFRSSLGILVIDAEAPGPHVAPSALDAEPPRFRLTRSGALIMKIRASLSASTEPFPIADQAVSFRAGERRLCTATTDDDGVARCRIKRVGRMFLTLVARGYVASFAGSGAFGPSSDDAPLFE